MDWPPITDSKPLFYIWEWFKDTGKCLWSSIGMYENAPLCCLFAEKKRELNNLLVTKGHMVLLKNDGISRMFSIDTAVHGRGLK